MEWSRCVVEPGHCGPPLLSHSIGRAAPDADDDPPDCSEEREPGDRAPGECSPFCEYRSFAGAGGSRMRSGPTAWTVGAWRKDAARRKRDAWLGRRRGDDLPRKKREAWRSRSLKGGGGDSGRDGVVERWWDGLAEVGALFMGPHCRALTRDQ
eukprot:837519-Prymnesium_polylepis.1